jgi:CTP synthase
MPSALGEMKSKPTQNAIRQLNSYGVHADIIIARSRLPMDEKRREKIANSCSISPDQVVSAPNIECIYEVPLNFEKGKLTDTIVNMLSLGKRKTDLEDWRKFVLNCESKKEIKIAVVGKYFNSGDFTLSDSYISVIEALKISAFHLKAKPVLTWISASDFESNPEKLKELSNFNGIVVPGGFGEKGIEGKLAAIKYARENKIPYFGLCYGMQLMVIEYARNILGWADATTSEITQKSKHLVIDIMPDQKEKLLQKDFGGSMRLGAYKAVLKDGTVAQKAYGTANISERHRHRYEVNGEFIKDIEEAGLVFSGTSPDGRLMEIAELPASAHPFFLGTQFHPEFKARPLSPHPLFTAFIKAALKKSK